jgi:mannose-6-phosphate isomerase
VPTPTPDLPIEASRIRVDRPVRPAPAPSLRPWGGSRLTAASGGLAGVGELWLAGPDSIVDAGAGDMTLDEVAAAVGEPFLGTRPIGLLGRRFPLIVKLIDAADWLSLQVHPDDALAQDLYGPDALGKAEAWLVLDADPGTRLVTGPRRDLDAAGIRTHIAAGTLGHAECEDRQATPGDLLLLETGTIHAIGAGAFVYEVEQPSDLTFRISDWGRPASPGRTLHVAEALRAVNPDAHAIPAGRDWRLDAGSLIVREFRLDLEALDAAASRRPAGASLEVVTAIGGPVTATGEGWTVTLGPLETVVIPASIPEYRLDGDAGSRACVASVA